MNQQQFNQSSRFDMQSQSNSTNLNKDMQYQQNNQSSQFNMNIQNPQYNQMPNNQTMYSNIKYGNGETEYVMTMKDLLIYILIGLIPIYNIIFMIKVALGPTSRTNKTMTNFIRLSLIFGLVMTAFSFFITIIGVTMFSSMY